MTCNMAPFMFLGRPRKKTGTCKWTKVAPFAWEAECNGRTAASPAQLKVEDGDTCIWCNRKVEVVE